ncbi:MAG: hypothetical protein ABJD24_08580 [Acidimicrobiales bacterium]
MRWAAAVGAVAARPRLWPTAFRQVRRLVPSRWWTRAPFMPVPDRDYLRFRLTTHYGDPRGHPSGHDVVSYLAWCAQMRQVGA